jgi:predicted dehydrogenase
MNRRYFLQSAMLSAAAAKTGQSASDKVTIAIMGVRGRGRALAGLFSSLPDVNISCLCDVDPGVYDKAAKTVEANHRKRPPLVADVRRILDDKSIDALVIAAPDHWHAPATILACDAGKDVYVEKPASHNLREGRLMIEAARRNKRIVQLGTQARSRPVTQRAIEYVKSGKIGKVLMAKAWDVQLRDHIGHKEDSPVPNGVDYEAWLGAAPFMPFNENRFHYKWHWNWNFGTGDVGNDGIHQIDMARWALGVETPVEVSGMGRKLFFDDDQQTPDTMNIAFNYPDKVLQFEMRIWNPYALEGIENGVSVYGTEGMVQIGKSDRVQGYRVYDKEGKQVFHEENSEPETHHGRNFIDCIRSRKAPNAEIEIGHTSTLHAHLANIVARTGRTVKFDGKTETLAGDPDANRYLRRQYRKHWATPKNV